MSALSDYTELSLSLQCLNKSFYMIWLLLLHFAYLSRSCWSGKIKIHGWSHPLTLMVLAFLYRWEVSFQSSDPKCLWANALIRVYLTGCFFRFVNSFLISLIFKSSSTNVFNVLLPMLPAVALSARALDSLSAALNLDRSSLSLNV